MSFAKWTHQQYRPATAARYIREAEKFNAKHHKPGRTEVLDYLSELRKSGKQSGTLRTVLAALKAWFDYEQETGQREGHPCKYLRLRDAKHTDVQFQDLFTAEELESLLDYESRYQLLTQRNRMILSLLIYQGLTNGELCKLHTRDIDLDKAQINIPAHGRANSRTLALKPRQILLIYRYLTADRAQLLAGNPDRGKLLITKKGTAETGEGISYLVQTLQNRFKSRKLTPKTIRMSVITGWLSAGIDLRKVQYMAGHKYPSSTQRYRQSDLEALKDSIDLHHPLG